MKEYKIIVPMSGTVKITICAEDPEKALDIFESKADEIFSHPALSDFEPEIERAIIYENRIIDENKIN